MPALSAMSATAQSSEAEHIYSTGRIMEVDRCASAWLIKRYIDPKAQFAFFEDGQLVTRGTAFDTPDARFCRTHKLSTFEVLMHHFKLNDPKLKALAAAIHEIEIDYWTGRKENPLAAKLSMQVREIIRANPDPGQCLEACFSYFDNLVQQLAH
jgi:hypothetical protein